MEIVPIKAWADHNARTVLFTAQVQDRDGVTMDVYVGVQIVTVGLGASQRVEARLMWVEAPEYFLDLRPDIPLSTQEALTAAGYQAYVNEANVVVSR